MGHTKIMVTIGPASRDEATLERLILAGANSCRINFAHTTYAQAEEIITLIRKISRRLNKPVAIRQDLQGPKIRIGKLKNDAYPLLPGHELTLVNHECVGDDQTVYVVQPGFIEALRTGADIVIGDNDIKLSVVKTDKGEARCKVTIPGILRPQKGVYAPGTRIPVDALTKKDIGDLIFGLEQKVDCVSLSFVQTADDLKHLKQIIAEHGASIPILAKIEQRNALKNLDEILRHCDGVSAARGDLGVECPLEELNLIDKEIIRRANLAGKFVFTGSGILKSLMHSAWPTRAEVCDVSSLVLDGIDAISFSDETAIGENPVACVETLKRIIDRTESVMLSSQENNFFRSIRPHFQITHSKQPILMASNELLPVAGIAKMHYSKPVVVGVQKHNLANYLSHYWGVTPIYCPSELSHEECLNFAHQEAIRLGVFQEEESPILL